MLFVYCSIACLKHGSITFFISIFYFCSLLRPLFFITVVAVSLSFGFLPCKGMAVLSDTKHQAKPYSAKTFSERLPQMLHIWVFQKTFYRIVWCSDSWEPPFLYARKKATWWRDDGMIKKNIGSKGTKSRKRQWIDKSRINFYVEPFKIVRVWNSLLLSIGKKWVLKMHYSSLVCLASPCCCLALWVAICGSLGNLW